MKALVTGGAGFIGSHICDALLRKGYEVVCVDNLVAGRRENIAEHIKKPGFEFWQKDVVALPQILMDGVDIVFHNAASKCTVCMDDPVLDLDVNAKGTLHVLQCAQRAGVKKFVHASTGSVNNGRPASFYGVSKQAGESYVRVFNRWFSCNILRYYHVYGSRQDDSDRGGVIPIFIRKALSGEPITVHGDGQQVRHFTHVSDVVAANLWMIDVDMKYTREFDLISDTKITIIALAHMIKELIGSDSEIVFTDEKPGDIKQFNATNDAMKMTGFKFGKKFEKGLLETVEWYSKRS
jgi:UDP-glucose 4-epimerase